MYEEILDRSTAMKKLEFHEELKPVRYQNVPEEDTNEKSDIKNLPLNGVHRRPVTPSAPYEEELQQTQRKCVPNDYSVLRDTRNSGNINQVEESADSTNQSVTEIAAIISNESFDQSDLKVVPSVNDEPRDLKKDIKTTDGSGLPSDSAVDSKTDASADMEDRLSQKSSHSYENLHKSGTPSGEYDSLVTDDLNVNSPMLQEQSSELCVSASPSVLNSDRKSLECVDAGNMSMPVKLVQSPASDKADVNIVTGEGNDTVAVSGNCNVGQQDNVEC